MARLAYANPADPDKAPLVPRIVAERGSLLHLYGMLLHSPPIAEGWLALFTAIRHRSTLPGDVRELVIMRIAHLNGAPYEAEQHRPIALKEGLTAAQVDAVPGWQSAGIFDDRAQAVLAYCDAMTREVHVPDAVFARVRAHFDERRMVELTATIAGYNLVSRFLEAVQIAATDDMGAPR